MDNCFRLLSSANSNGRGADFKFVEKYPKSISSVRLRSRRASGDENQREIFCQ
jgi:hypothetical protein